MRERIGNKTFNGEDRKKKAPSIVQVSKGKIGQAIGTLALEEDFGNLGANQSCDPVLKPANATTVILGTLPASKPCGRQNVLVMGTRAARRIKMLRCSGGAVEASTFHDWVWVTWKGAIGEDWAVSPSRSAECAPQTAARCSAIGSFDSGRDMYGPLCVTYL